MGLLIPILLIALCCIIIWRAGDGFETASLYLGRKLSEGVRGATINAIGSSMPEVVTTFFFLFYLEDVDGFSGGIGTTAGSSLFNGMIIPATVILVVIFMGVTKNIQVSKRVLRRDGFSLLIAEFVFIMFLSSTAIGWHHGLILMLLYFIYVAYMLIGIRKRKKVVEAEIEEVELNDKPWWRNLLTLNMESLVLKSSNLTRGSAWKLLLASTFVMSVACLLLVQACEWIGKDTYELPLLGEVHGLNIPVLFVAVILASAASSVPDTLISIKDAQKGNYDDAVSNALGSNIFDICFALGFPLFIYTLINGPIFMSPQIIELSAELRMLLFILTILAVIIYLSGKTMGKFKALGLLGLYLLFTFYVIGRSNEIPIVMDISAFFREVVEFIDIQI